MLVRQGREPLEDQANPEFAEASTLVVAEPVAAAEVVVTDPTYVGREVCRECHAENYKLHGQHGHAHTFAVVDGEIADKFAGRTFDAGELFGTYTYESNEQGLFTRLRDKVGDEPFPLQYSLGSGHHAITLLTLIPDAEKGTVGLEHRVSWFREHDQLGLTPGQVDGVPDTLGEMFGNRHEDRVMHKCVYCHVTTGDIVDQKIINLTPNVNCEKCHGPASEHVRQARLTRTPPAFSVGRDDWDTESEIQLCGDCHRLPNAISRKELRAYPVSLARFQPIGLLRSKCYVASSGELKCTTCHNPHTTVKAVSPVEQVQNCVNCHLEDSDAHVVCPISPQTGCIECHMPAIDLDDIGIRFHDHWIRVRDDD